MASYYLVRHLEDAAGVQVMDTGDSLKAFDKPEWENELVIGPVREQWHVGQEISYAYIEKHIGADKCQKYPVAQKPQSNQQ